MRETFIEKDFRADSLEIIAKANVILAEYERQGLVLTLRQLYYQFVARGFLANKIQNYTRLGSIVSDARLAGMIDWSMMEDRLRQIEEQPKWGSPSDIVAACARQYREDLWRTQRWRPEVWIEKDALVGVIERICNELRAPYFACRGYSSQSAQYEAGLRFRKHLKARQKPIIFHLGDHDPSGIDMTRDNMDRVSMFAGERITVKRLALNRDQVDQYSPPPNPAKGGDPRFAGYTAEHGDESWELDALEPTVIVDLIRNAINPLIDRPRWQEGLDEEAAGRRQLEDVSDRWSDVMEFLGCAHVPAGTPLKSTATIRNIRDRRRARCVSASPMNPTRATTNRKLAMDDRMKLTLADMKMPQSKRERIGDYARHLMAPLWFWEEQLYDDHLPRHA